MSICRMHSVASHHSGDGEQLVTVNTKLLQSASGFQNIPDYVNKHFRFCLKNETRFNLAAVAHIISNRPTNACER